MGDSDGRLPDQRSLVKREDREKLLLLLLALKIVGTGADDGRVDDTSDSTIKLSSTETELLKKALEEAAEQASLPAAGETTQFLRKKTETPLKADGSASPPRRTLI